jgi:hypothetical protein
MAEYDEFGSPIDSVPFGSDDADDNFALPSGIADGKNNKKILEEQSFPPVPRGRNDFVVKKVEVLTKSASTGDFAQETKYEEKSFKCFTDNGAGDLCIPDEYSAHVIQVTYALASDPTGKITVREQLRMPPLNEAEHDLYLHASTSVGGKSIKSFFYNALRHTLSALGHDCNEDGTLPAAAQQLREWRVWPDGTPRIVSLDIIDQKKDKEVQKARDGSPYASIKSFSHAKSDDTNQRLGIVPAVPEQPAQKAPPKATAANAKPAAPAQAQPAPATQSAPQAAQPAVPAATKPIAHPTLKTGPAPSPAGSTKLGGKKF